MATRATLERLRRFVPHGQSLPAEVWAVRHQWVVAILGVQAACLPVFGVLRGYPLTHSLLEAVLPVLMALTACVPGLGRLTRSSIAGVGLMVVSGVVVHLSGGTIEAHFHFFVMVPVVALYESWVPFGLAVAYVLVQHGVVGTLNSESVYNHQSAQQRPWVWAGIHAALFAAACVGSIVNWRLHEEARAVEQRLTDDLAHQAQRDALTGLPNRAHLHERGQQAIADALADDRPLSVLMIDLDRFKQINDTLGHAWGDALLREIGPRLSSVLRERDLLARLGGDEFAVLLPGLGQLKAQEVTERLRRRLREGFRVDGIDLDVDASIGLATLPSSAEAAAATAAAGAAAGAGPAREADRTVTIDELLRQADVAMYAAKQSGCGAVAYAPDQDENSRVRLSLLSELRRALDEDQLLLHFQPKLDLVTGAVTGVEALVRWQHPTRGLLVPADFIPAAEATPLIVPLTDRVIDLALAETRVWHDSGRPLQVAVNVAPRCLLDADFPTRVEAMLRRHGIPGASLRIEITETSLMSDPEAALQSLEALAELGVGLSLDDFGSGYSSMAYLRRLPVDELKVDRAFTAGMTGSKSDAIIVRSAIDLGHNLGLRVVAEGVEDSGTLRALLGDACDVAQGFHIARPMPAEGLRQWLHGRGGAPAGEDAAGRRAGEQPRPHPEEPAAAGVPGP